MQHLNLDVLNINNHNPYIFNLILWICSFVILLFAFSPDNNPAKIDVMYTGLFLCTIVPPVLINLYGFIPIFLKKEKYVIYIISVVLTILVFVQINSWFFDNLVDYIFPDYFFISYHSNTKLTTIFSIFIVGTTLVKLSEDWFYYNKRENEKLKVAHHQIQSQLAVLRSQINPHFLFNSLNVIYSLALDKKKETTEALVKLSDILRYVIYDSNTERVSLKDEIDLIENYLAFQKYRQRANASVTFSAIILNDDYQIYPMILLPFVENSFKHGLKSDPENAFIKIEIDQKRQEFRFLIENNFVEVPIENKEHSGLGIENIKRNLDIVYKENYILNIQKSEKLFSVTLTLSE